MRFPSVFIRVHPWSKKMAARLRSVRRKLNSAPDVEFVHAQPAAAPGRRNHSRPGADSRRRGHGQDARHHLPHRAHGRARDCARQHPRRDVHEQGRARNAGARHASCCREVEVRSQKSDRPRKPSDHLHVSFACAFGFSASTSRSSATKGTSSFTTSRSN